ncbi:MAG: isochorismatase family protein [Myxococcota bacterium]
MHPKIIDPEQAFLVLVDVQEGYRKALHAWERVIERCAVLVRGFRTLELPVFYTEQYPKGLGPTAYELHELLEGVPRFEKLDLSALGAPGLLDALEPLGRKVAVVCGIETHACINHTAHDLLARGYDVHIPVDAVSSRRLIEHEIGYAKLLRSGVVGASVESALLECVRSAAHPRFKAIHALLK